MSLQQAQKSKGKFDATVDVAKNTYNDVKKLVTDPIGVLKETKDNLKNFASHPLATVKTMAGSVKDSFEKDVIHGNDYSRAYWGTKATINTATAVVGTKGVGTLTKIGKTSTGVTSGKSTSSSSSSKGTDNNSKNNGQNTSGTEKRFPTKQINPIKDQHIIDKVAEARGALSNRYKKQGNFAYAEVDIVGINKKDFYAHSGIHDATKKIPGAEDFSFKPNKPTFEATKAYDNGGNNYLRDGDTEYKILNDLAERVGDNYKAKGKIKLFTEKDTCDSCNLIIQQFNDKYPDITIEVIHNADEMILPNK